MTKIVFLDSYSIAQTDLGCIKALGQYTSYDYCLQNQVVERAKDADVIITNKVKVMEAEMKQLPNLKLICVAATGVNNVDTQYAAAHGIEVRNVPAYSTESVAEATLSMVLALLRNVVYYDRYVKNGAYATSGQCFNLGASVSEIKGKRWGVVAMGNIGQRVAQIASVMGAEVVYYSTSGKNHNATGGYRSLSLEELLRTSDIVSIHAPLNEATKGLLAYEQFKMMKPTSIIINVGRGGILVEKDLALALDQDLIAGAGLDVFVNEPIELENQLLKIKNSDKLVLAPHCGWSSEEAREVLVQKIAENISTFFN